MTARLPKRLRDRSRVHADFEAVMNSGAPIVDMIGDGRMEYDGPRCECGTPLPEDAEQCDDCLPCPACRGAGAWQQYDGALEECPRGCATEDDHQGGAA